MIKQFDTVLSINNTNLRTSNRAGYYLALLRNKLDKNIYSQLENKLETWLQEEPSRIVTKNTIRNALFRLLLSNNREAIKENIIPFENNIHTLSKIYGFGDEYFSSLQKYITGEKISVTTKRNIFLSLYLKYI